MDESLSKRIAGERREKRIQRREKQRIDNIGRAAKMHHDREQSEMEAGFQNAPPLLDSAYVGCSGWFYWKWGGVFYPSNLPPATGSVTMPDCSKR